MASDSWKNRFDQHEPNYEHNFQVQNSMDNDIEERRSASGAQGKFGRIPNSWPEQFSGEADGPTFPQWQRSNGLWIAGEDGQLPASVIGPRVLSVLFGTAGLVTNHLSAEDVQHEGGLELIYSVLEKSPLMKEMAGAKGDRVHSEFKALKRRTNESMDSFVTRAVLLRQELLRQDPNFGMGERFFVGHLLDGAQITGRDRAMVLGGAGHKLTESDVCDALRRLGPHLAGKVPIGVSEHIRPTLERLPEGPRRGPPRRPGRMWLRGANDTMQASNGSGGSSELDLCAAYAGTPSAGTPTRDEANEEIEVHYQEELVPEEFTELLNEAMLADYETFQVTGRLSGRAQDLTRLRGHYSREALAHKDSERAARIEKLKQERPCRKCGALGHWSRDPACPQNQGQHGANVVENAVGFVQSDMMKELLESSKPYKESLVNFTRVE